MSLTWIKKYLKADTTINIAVNLILILVKDSLAPRGLLVFK